MNTRTDSCRVVFMMDEAGRLQRFTAVDTAVVIGRAYGVILYMIYQSVSQLRQCFSEGQDQTLLSNTSQVYFAVNDGATAELVSTRLGDETIIVDSGGTSYGTSTQDSHGPHPSWSRGTSYSENHNWQQQARRLLKSEEVLQLPPRTAITFTPGVPPIRTRLLRYYEEPWMVRDPLGRQSGWTARLAAAASLLWCVTLLSLAAAMTAGVGYRLQGGNLMQLQPPVTTTQPTLLQGDPDVRVRSH